MSTDDRTPRPDPDSHDEAYERVRAADPAASRTPDLAAIADRDATVRAHLGTAFGDAARVPSGAGDEDQSELDELAVHRERRRRRMPLTAVAAVAGVLAFGVGGYALGSAGGSGGTSASTAQGPIVLPGFANDGSAGAMAERGVADSAMSGIVPGGYGGRTVFTSSGLGTDETTAPAWAFDAASIFSAETVAEVATALGVSGEPRQEYGAWTVGSPGGTGATVSIQPDGVASMSFNDPGKDPWACMTVMPLEGAEAPATEEMRIDPQAGCGEPDLGKAPSADAAIASSRDVLGSLGLDPAGFEYTTESYDEEGRILAVTASQVVEGQRTGIAWNLTYSGAGLSSLYGALAPTVSIGDYSVVSPSAAVERLGDPRFAGAGMIAYARAQGVEGSDAIESFPADPEPQTVPPTAGKGAALSWPVQEVTITLARLGWAVHYQGDGGAVLVPSYELSDAAGNVWSVIAVTDEELDFAPAG